MLVLSRRIDETIVIKQEGRKDIVITYVAHRLGQVRLGFDADLDVKIFRGELLERQREQQ